MTPAQKRIWGWMAFDLAQQPYATLGLTFVFGPYFAQVASGLFETQGADPTEAAAQAQSLWGLAQTIAGLAIALTAPLLGAYVDASGRRLAWIAGLSLPYLLCAWSLWWLLPDGTHLLPVLALFWVGFVAGESALNVNNAQLPSLAGPRGIGRLSGSGAALGYWGGVASLAIMLLLFSQDGAGLTLLGRPPALGLDMEAQEGTRAVGPFIAIWYAVFIIPFFLWTRDPAVPARKPPLREVWTDLKGTLRDVVRRPSLLSFLTGSMLYRDALSAIYSFGGLYAALVLSWSTIQIGIFGIVAAIAAAIVTFAGGLADQRLGPKPVIMASIWSLLAVCTIIVGMSRESIFGIALAPGSVLPDVVFYVCGGIIGGAGGALYSASRTLMVLHADPAHPASAFGLFALTGRATAFVAPALIALTTWLTGSTHLGFLPVIALFLAGLVLLGFTRPQGDRDPWPASPRSSPSS